MSPGTGVDHIVSNTPGAAGVPAQSAVGVHCTEAGQQLRQAVSAVAPKAQLPAVTPARYPQSYCLPELSSRAGHSFGMLYCEAVYATRIMRTCAAGICRGVDLQLLELCRAPAPDVDAAVPGNGRAVVPPARHAHDSRLLHALHVQAMCKHRAACFVVSRKMPCHIIRFTIRVGVLNRQTLTGSKCNRPFVSPEPSCPYPL